jgi:predicted RecB family endonuclease
MISNTTPRISKEPSFTSADEIPFLPKFLIDQDPTQSEQYHLELKEWWESVDENLNRMREMVVNYQVAESREESASELSNTSRLLSEQSQTLVSNLDTVLTGDITNLNTSLSSDITNLDTTLTQDIASLNTSLSSDITNLNTSLSEDITNLDTSLSEDITNLDTTLSEDITNLNTTLTQSIANVSTNVSTNATNISTNTSDIATNATNLSTHESDTANPHSVTKSQVGLGNVQNTALSTWQGSQNITTLGTIATGTVPTGNISGLSAVATSGAYSDLSGTPTFTYDSATATLTIST